MRPGIRLAIIFLIAFFITLIILYESVYLPLQDQTTTLSPARPLAGTWVGTAAFTDNTETCQYQGPISLHLTQNGNQLTGSFTVMVNESTGPDSVRIGTIFTYQVQGTVSSSSVTLTVAGVDTLKGSYLTNNLALRWEDNQNTTTSGPAIKFTGIVSLIK